MSKLPYIVLLGDVGAGKSKIVEKLSGATGRSSDSNKSFTLASAPFQSFDQKMIICDTPGSNAMENQFQHNLHIAYAMNFYPVRCVMIVVKADTRMDNVVKIVREYAECFLPGDLPEDLISVCITHMDTVKWKESELLPHLKNHLGINTAIFSSLGSTPAALSQAFMYECDKKRDVKLSIDGENFLKLFKLNGNGMKAVRESKREVGRFEKMKQDYYIQKNAAVSEADQMNMAYDFQAWLLLEITKAQERLSNNNGFTFVSGPNMASEAGHVSNLTNQLRKILGDVRIDAAKYNKDVDTNFKKCPYCGEVWQKIQGCDGATECGNRPTSPSDDWSTDMSTFSFNWDSSTMKLIIRKLGKMRKRPSTSTSSTPVKASGCGQIINWSSMASVSPPLEFDVNPATTKDVKTLPPRAFKPFNEAFDAAINKLERMQVSSVKK